MLDKYIDLFCTLFEQTEYFNSLQLCLTFQEGLQSILMERIDNFVKGVKITLNENTLSTIMGTGYGGEMYFKNFSRKEQL